MYDGHFLTLVDKAFFITYLGAGALQNNHTTRIGEERKIREQ
jgi:hypothetical protein